MSDDRPPLRFPLIGYDGIHAGPPCPVYDDRKGHFVRGCPYPWDQCKCDQYEQGDA